MSEQTYLDFDLLIRRTAEGYQARGWDSHGRVATVDFERPFSEAEIEDFRRGLDVPRSKLRWWRSSEAKACKRFGARLFKAVFRHELLGIFRQSLEDAERAGAGLRVRLRLAEVPELAGLPWEYLYDTGRNRFFALSKETPVVRYLELPERIRPLAVRPPLRMLVVLANPEDYTELDAEREWHRLNEALSDLKEQGLIELHRLEEATLPALQHRLRRGEFHILHFIGHGGFNERTGEGVLILEGEAGRGRPT